jgi:hypothetical protein
VRISKRLIARCLLIAVLVLAVSSALADDFKTSNGKEYKNAKLSRVEPDGIVITFSAGIVKLPFIELPADVRKKYGFDSQAAATYAKEENRKQAALAQQRQTEAQKRVEEREKYWSEHPGPQPQQHSVGLTGSALDRDAGPKPTQLEDGTVVSLDQQIRQSLFDPDSLIYESRGELKVGQSPGGNPVWTITITYRAKNRYGAYTGNRMESYWLKDGFWNLRTY